MQEWYTHVQIRLLKKNVLMSEILGQGRRFWRAGFIRAATVERHVISNQAGGDDILVESGRQDGEAEHTAVTAMVQGNLKPRQWFVQGHNAGIGFGDRHSPGLSQPMSSGQTAERLLFSDVPE